MAGFSQHWKLLWGNFHILWGRKSCYPDNPILPHLYVIRPESPRKIEFTKNDDAAFSRHQTGKLDKFYVNCGLRKVAKLSLMVCNLFYETCGTLPSCHSLVTVLLSVIICLDVNSLFIYSSMYLVYLFFHLNFWFFI